MICRECAWNHNLSDCETKDDDNPGDFDLCWYPNDIEKVKKDDGTFLIPRHIRCKSHRTKGYFKTRLGNWCGKEGRWFIKLEDDIDGNSNNM